jgi:HEPN domain-containing protein
MSQSHTDPGEDSQDELERLLIEGIETSPAGAQSAVDDRDGRASRLHYDRNTIIPPDSEDEEEDTEDPASGDIQGALGLFAEATQDMATAGVELSLGRHFACVDFCNQAVEKAAQAVSLLHFGRRSMYDHDLRALGVLVGAPQEIQDEMALLTPFHPEAFYAGTPPEEADEVIPAEQASVYVQHARHVLKWARNIILRTSGTTPLNGSGLRNG